MRASYWGYSVNEFSNLREGLPHCRSVGLSDAIDCFPRGQIVSRRPREIFAFSAHAEGGVCFNEHGGRTFRHETEKSISTNEFRRQISRLQQDVGLKCHALVSNASSCLPVNSRKELRACQGRASRDKSICMLRHIRENNKGSATSTPCWVSRFGIEPWFTLPHAGCKDGEPPDPLHDEIFCSTGQKR